MQEKNVKQIQEKEFEEEVLKSELPVFVDFYADWCGPCRIIEPIIEDLSKEYDGRVKFVRINVDYSPNISSQYGIMAIPTLIIFRNGKPAKTQIGAASRAMYKRMIDEVINSHS